MNPDGTPYAGDPRYALKTDPRQEGANQGYTFYVGPELEYFYFKDSEPEILDQGGYFDLTPATGATDLRRETIFALQSMGIRVEYSHHEVAPSQHEIDLRYVDALTMADTVMTYRVVVKEIALQTRRLRHLHAQAHLRPERQRHARPPVPVQGQQERLLRRQGQVPPVRAWPRATSPGI